MDAGVGPRIVSPDGSTAYRLRRDAPAEYQQVPLIARVSPGTARLYWYEDGVLVTESGIRELTSCRREAIIL